MQGFQMIQKSSQITQKSPKFEMPNEHKRGFRNQFTKNLNTTAEISSKQLKYTQALQN